MFHPQPNDPRYMKRVERSEAVLETYTFCVGRDADGKKIVILVSPTGSMYRCSSNHTCTCADFARNGHEIPCKHLLAAYEFLRAQRNPMHKVEAASAASKPVIVEEAAGAASETHSAEIASDLAPEPASAASTPAAAADLRPVVALLATAAEKVKFPRFTLTCAGQVIQFRLAGEKSRTPGSVNLTNGRRWDDPKKKYWGRIDTNGQFIPNRMDCGALEIPFRELLAELAATPAVVIAREGHLTQACCLCSRDLNDPRSLEAGYGPVCAKTWGLPWGETPEPRRTAPTPEETAAIRRRRLEDFPD
jgi:hypothetical protein